MQLFSTLLKCQINAIIFTYYQINAIIFTYYQINAIIFTLIKLKTIYKKQKDFGRKMHKCF